MAPFATVILAIPALVLEGAGVLEWLHTHPSIVPSLIIIFGSGVMAFCLNFSIFYVIHSTTAVTFNVAGNLKVSFNGSSCTCRLVCLNALALGAFYSQPKNPQKKND